MDEDQIDDQPVDELEEGTEEEEVEETEEADDEQQEPTDELTEAPEAEAEDNQPASVFLPTGEGPATARLREMLDPDVNAAVQAAIQEQVTRAMQSFGVTQANYQVAAAQHPDIFKKYGPRIQQALSMFPEGERHTRKAVDIAMMFVLEDKAGKPEFARELLKFAQQLNGAATAPKPPKPPIPAASRPPTPSSGVRSQAMPPREQRIKDLMKEFGLDREEAEGMFYEASRKPVRR